MKDTDGVVKKKWHDSTLNFSLHCDKAAACATKILGMLNRKFVKISKDLYIFVQDVYT